jgi:hypothetical protein
VSLVAPSASRVAVLAVAEQAICCLCRAWLPTRGVPRPLLVPAGACTACVETPTACQSSSAASAGVGLQRLLRFVRLSSERVRQAVPRDCSFAEKQAPPPALLVVVPWERRPRRGRDSRVVGLAKLSVERAEYVPAQHTTEIVVSPVLPGSSFGNPDDDLHDAVGWAHRAARRPQVRLDRAGSRGSRRAW